MAPVQNTTWPVDGASEALEARLAGFLFLENGCSRFLSGVHLVLMLSSNILVDEQTYSVFVRKLPLKSTNTPNLFDTRERGCLKVGARPTWPAGLSL